MGVGCGLARSPRGFAGNVRQLLRLSAGVAAGLGLVAALLFTGYEARASLEWNTFLGSSDIDANTSVARDSLGNVYVCGYSKATWGSPIRAHAGGGKADVFVAKLNSSGSLQWNTFMGGSESDYSGNIAVDSTGNVYVCGYSYATWGSPLNGFAGGRDVFVARLSSSGQLLWHTFMGSTDYDEKATLAVSASGIYVSGQSYKNWGSPIVAHPTTRQLDIFVAKLDENGGIQWNTFMGGSESDYNGGITMDGAGNLYVVGHSRATWGNPVRSFAGTQDALVAKLNSSGHLQWNTFLGYSASYDYGYGITVNGTGVYIAGSAGDWGLPIRAHSGDLEAYAAKLNSTTGDYIWHTYLGSADDDIAYGIDLDPGGSPYVIGYSKGTWGDPVDGFAAAKDAFTCRLDTNGALQWNTFLGGAGNDTGQSVIAVGADSLIAAGYTSDRLSEAAEWGDPIRVYSSYDCFVATLEPGPEMDVAGGAGNISIPDEDDSPCVEDGTDFGEAEVGSNVDHVFTIQNKGTENLNLTGSPVAEITGDVDDFTVSAQPTSPVTAGNSTPFTVRFHPTVAEARQAQISIANNDTDENPYNFTICGTGTGTVGAPEIDVQGKGLTIADDDTTPSADDDTGFQAVPVAGGTVTHAFTIENKGDADLNITEAVSLSNTTDFSLTQPLSTTIGTGESTTFTVTFDPASGGSKSSTLTIPNNDEDETIYNYTIQGVGVDVADLNADGTIDPLDARLCLQIATGVIQGTTAQRTAADVDGDGDVDEDDAAILAEYVLGQRTGFPGGQ